MKNYWLTKKVKINIFVSENVAFHFRDREKYPTKGDMPKGEQLLETVYVPIDDSLKNNIVCLEPCNLAADALNKHFLNFYLTNVEKTYKGCGPAEDDPIIKVWQKKHKELETCSKTYFPGRRISV